MAETPKTAVAQAPHQGNNNLSPRRLQSIHSDDSRSGAIRFASGHEVLMDVKVIDLHAHNFDNANCADFDCCDRLAIMDMRAAIDEGPWRGRCGLGERRHDPPIDQPAPEARGPLGLLSASTCAVDFEPNDRGLRKEAVLTAL